MNRTIRDTKDGIELEAALRHAELNVKPLGVENVKELTCPSADEVKRSGYTTQYESIVSRAKYLSMGRPDIQFAVKKLATSIAKATTKNLIE